MRAADPVQAAGCPRRKAPWRERPVGPARGVSVADSERRVPRARRPCGVLLPPVRAAPLLSVSDRSVKAKVVCVLSAGVSRVVRSQSGHSCVSLRCRSRGRLGLRVALGLAVDQQVLRVRGLGLWHQPVDLLPDGRQEAGKRFLLTGRTEGPDSRRASGPVLGFRKSWEEPALSCGL